MSPRALQIHLKALPSPASDNAVHHFIEDVQDPVNARNPHEFGLKLRAFLDDIDHLKFLNHIEFVEDSHLTTEDRARFKNFERVAQKVIHDLKEALGGREDSLLGIKNIFENLTNILQRASIDDVRVRKPFHAVAVSAGPSLELEFGNLRKIQEHALIICVDAVLRRLLEEKIVPHIVVATERFNDTLPFFENLPPLPNTLFVGQATIAKELFDLYPGPVVTASKFTGPFLWLPIERKHEWSGSCVSHLAYSIACRLGAESVALVGQDLCYHPDTFQSHAYLPAYPEWSQPVALENTRHNQRSTYFVPGNTRSRVPTQADWDMFAHEFEILVAQTKNSTWNTSQLGMKIASIPYISLNEWIQKYIAGLEKIKIEFPQKNENFKSDLQKVRLKIEDAQSLLGALRESLRSVPADKIESTYSHLMQYPNFMELVLESVIRDYVRVESIRFASEDSEKIQGATKDYFGGIVTVLDSLLSYLDDASLKLKAL